MMSKIKAVLVGSVLFTLIISSGILFNSYVMIKQPLQDISPKYNDSVGTTLSLHDKFEDRDAMGSADEPAAFWKWFYKERSGPHHSIPSNSYMKATYTMKAMSTHYSTSKKSVAPHLSNTWSSVGPSPITSCSVMGGYCSGRVAAVALDPSHPGTIYLGAAQGGVWKSTDNGTTWTPLTDNQPSLAIGSIAVDSSGNVYVGTGEGNLSCDSYYGVGVLKSTDGGSTWTQLGAATFGSSTITKIIINATNPNVILASTSYGFTTSSTNACQFVSPNSSTGVYRSTNGGSTWSSTLSPGPGASDLVIDPSNSAIVYAAISGNGIYKSTNGGVNWSLLSSFPVNSTNGLGRIALGITSAPSTIFAAINVNSTGQLYKSTNGGSGWSLVNTPLGPFGGAFCEGQCWYDIFIAPDPTSANILYLGGLNLYRSTDGGTNWTDLGGYSGNIHPDQHAFAFDPASHTHIFEGNDGGIWSATAGNTCSPASCWANLNQDLTITQFQSIAAHPSTAGTFFGGTQDNGSPQHTGSSIWTLLDGGDGGWTAYDPSNPVTMYHTYFNASPARSDNSGVTWNDISSTINQADPTSFYVPMAIDSQSPSTLYIGTNQLYKTTNQGNNWSPLSSPAADNFGVLSAIAVAPSDDHYVYVGTSNGTFYASTNSASSFTSHTTGLSSNTFLTKIAVDPSNPQKVYATFSGFGVPHVFFSSNSGSTWTDITSNLPDTPTNAILVRNGNIYVGTDIGPFVSNNGGTSWSVLGSNFPHVTIFDLALTSDGHLLAATHGRGVFSLSTNCAPPNSGDWTITINCTLSQNATAPANVIVQNGAVLTIPNGLSLNIDFMHFHLLVKSNSGVLIKSGGKIQ